MIVVLDNEVEVIQTFEQGPPGPQGIPGIQGPVGPNGEDGNTVLYGPNDPIFEGVDGDFWINTTTHFIFGPKAAGVWPAGTSLVGPQGVAGPQGPQGPQGPAGPTINPATAVPLIDGVGAVGNSVKYAREDHVHPSDVAASAVRFDAVQALTGAQLLQARQNICAAPGDAMSYSGIQVNGSGEVSQRLGATPVTLVSGTPRYIVDSIRAGYFHAANTAIMSAQQLGAGPPGFSAGIQLTSAGAPMSAPGAGDNASLSVPVEGYRCQRLGWNTAGATQPLTACFFFYSNVAGTFSLNVRNGANDRSYSKSCAYSNAANWTFYKVTIPPPPSGNWATGFNTSIDFRITAVCGTTYQQPDGAWANGNFLGTPATTNFFAASGNFCAATGFALLPGSDGPKDWQSLAACQRSFVNEFHLCQRYYEKSFQYLTVPAQGTGFTSNSLFLQAGGAGTQSVQPTFFFKASKRAIPTITLFNPQNGNALARNVSRASDWAATALNSADVDCFQIYGTSPGSSAIFDTCGIHWTAEAGL
ncbi:hypothetical protein [Bradyrhizobium cytisi]|uniref:hypothetical protein n=1 Tax=Bradyrhizobium cytisi TaxID=515489 RepID=UPI0016532EFA|nr:hypothetical protein [Bradyrhizobium cytisi]